MRWRSKNTRMDENFAPEAAKLSGHFDVVVVVVVIGGLVISLTVCTAFGVAGVVFDVSDEVVDPMVDSGARVVSVLDGGSSHSATLGVDTAKQPVMRTALKTRMTPIKTGM